MEPENEALPYWKRPVVRVDIPVETESPTPVATEFVEAKPIENQEESSEEFSSKPNMQPVDLLATLKDAEHALDLARFEARQCRAATGEARAAFSKALEAWNRTQPVMTQDQQARAYIATNLAERARKAEAGLLRRPTTVGEMAKALAGGGHNVQRGGGRSYRRGAFSKAEALEINANRLRAAVAAKLPSQR